jgi:PhzF family phenazine biosynthesis protein
MSSDVLRYSAFATDPTGGNPAGIVLDAQGLAEADMLRIAAAVGYSETAFLVRRHDGEFDVRYFSPRAEVTFCGHATIAAAVAYAERNGPGALALHTRSGLVRVEVDDQLRGTLVSVAPQVVPLDPADLDEILAALGWAGDDLDPSLVPGIGYAGAWHPVIPVITRARLAELAYDFDRLGALMALRDWTTVALIWRENSEIIHARNPFPPGGVVEDPATGAAAAALGAYLADRNALPASRTFVVHQGDDLGRPSRLTVAVPQEHGKGIRVSGPAVAIENADPTRSKR